MRYTMPKTFPVTCHTDYVTTGTTFVAIRGFKSNGIDYIVQALEKGATTIVVQKDNRVPVPIIDKIQKHNAVLHYVENARKELALLSAQKAENPANRLSIIGVTGTKGKTTTCFLLEHILCAAGYKTALISSVKNSILTTSMSAPLTTPQADYLHQFLATAKAAGVTHVVVEVAAQALSLHRTYGITFSGALFTNFSHEHAEFYPSLQEYFDAKCTLFSQIDAGAPVLMNADDEWCAKLNSKVNNIQWFSLNNDQKQDLYLQVHNNNSKSAYDIFWKGNRTTYICPALIGTHNGYNIAAAVGMANLLSVEKDSIDTGLSSFKGVPGRCFQYLLPNGATAVIDYAHNPSSYQSILTTLRAMTDHLIVIFGAGGERDKPKRPIMGSIASEIADQIILTSDNPRSEDPNDIINDIMIGVDTCNRAKIIRELDRKQAIAKAYTYSKKGSIIALLGKGSDEYQIIGDNIQHFSEYEIISQLC